MVCMVQGSAIFYMAWDICRVYMVQGLAIRIRVDDLGLRA